MYGCMDVSEGRVLQLIFLDKFEKAIDSMESSPSNDVTKLDTDDGSILRTLSQALQWTESLHTSSSSSHATSVLGLRQLVPVHESLLTAMIARQPPPKSGVSSDVQSSKQPSESSIGTKLTDSIVRFLEKRKAPADEDGGSSEEGLERILKSQLWQPQKKLLVLQYLLLCQEDVPTVQPTSLHRLERVLRLTPWLLSEGEGGEQLHHDHDEATTHDDDSAAAAAAAADATAAAKIDASAWAEFYEAVLDVVFSKSVGVAPIDTSTMTEEESTLLLRQCLDELQRQSLASSRQSWAFCCRCLARLHEEDAFMQVHRAQIAQATVQLLLASLDAAVSRTVPPEWVLPSLHRDLLPLILNDSSSSLHLVSIWNHLWNTILWEVSLDGSIASSTPHTNNNLLDDAIHRYMLATTILCAIILPLLHHELPMPPSLQRSDEESSTTLSSATAFCRPLHCHALWHLIHQCVSQGLYVPKRQSWIEASWARRDVTQGGPNHTNPTTTTSTTHASSSSSNVRIPLGTAQLLRRRGLFLLNAVVDGGMTQTNNDPTHHEDKAGTLLLLLWKTYVACFETIEMEHAPHLIDQVWDSVADMSAQLDAAAPVSSPSAVAAVPPSLSWDWMFPLLARVITSSDSPSLRKLSLFRLFTGQAGIVIDPHQPSDDASAATAAATGGSRQKKSSTKLNKAGNRPAQAASGRPRGFPLRVVSPDFVLDVVFPAFDTLETSSGRMIHLVDAGKEVRHDMHRLLAKFLDAYLDVVAPDACEAFFRGVWSSRVLLQLNRRTTVLLGSMLADCVRHKPTLSIPTKPETYTALVEALRDLTSLGSLIPSQAEALTRAMAVLLSRSHPIEALPPTLVLNVLALFPVAPRRQALPLEEPVERTSNAEEQDEQSHYGSLSQWISNVYSNRGPPEICTVAGTLATAYVHGLLVPSATSSASSWDPTLGTSPVERDLGKAVAMLCTFACHRNGDRQPSTKRTPGELLWPAISKGLANHVPAVLVTKTWIKADAISRAILLLESGCKLEVISGLGNGDLVVDRKTQQMMPPPPNVEKLVGLSASFVLYHIQQLFSRDTDTTAESTPAALSATYMRLISQLETLHEGFPSSLAIPESVNNLLNLGLERLLHWNESSDLVCIVTTIYGALACGGESNISNQRQACTTLLELRYNDSSESSRDDQASRSVFEYAKWAALALMLPKMFATEKGNAYQDFVDTLVDKAVEAVQSAPQEGLMPIFNCVLTVAECDFESVGLQSSERWTTQAGHLDKLIRSFVRLMKDCKGSGKVALMIDQASAVLFRPELLLQEAHLLMVDAGASAPLRTAFRDFVQMAGSRRHHILEAALCRITAGWLGHSGQVESSGVSAIPYLDDIATLLMYKEERLDETSLGQTEWRKDRSGNFTKIPLSTDESSVSRGLLLQFLSQLPGASEGLAPTVMANLLNPLIHRLLDEVKPLSQGTVSLGSIDFIRKVRGWQGLCVLSRFVGADTASHVCSSVFRAMGEMLHGQVRYFIEVFTIQCCRNHPVVFGKALVREISRTDLSLQQVSSLMIVTGSLVAGRYQSDFIPHLTNSQLHLLLTGLIPWLGSTQGFSTSISVSFAKFHVWTLSHNSSFSVGRAIAQLLVYKIVPMVIDTKTTTAATPVIEGETNWYLLSVFKFLDQNSEMKRLRAKQTKFFDHYDAESVCTADGCLSLDVDDGGEALPIHAIEVMKECLRQVYEEANADNSPAWKNFEITSENQAKQTAGLSHNGLSSVINFQRKIIPMDALNLALEDMKEVRRRNRAGRKKQKLIVCATFIDKVPNLGGLARTAEIFAAEKLIIPDLRATKADSFKSVSVSATDWIEIEECKEVVSTVVKARQSNRVNCSQSSRMTIKFNFTKICSDIT